MKSPMKISRRQRGFNIIELMVGITISLFGLAAVSTMMMTFATKRASITSTLSAQDSGVMALFRIERDVAQAGYGLMHLQTCATITDGTAVNSPVPVTIGDGGTGSDTIELQYVNSRSGSPGTGLYVASPATIVQTSATYKVASSLGFTAGDYVVSNAATSVTTPTSCIVTKIAAPTGTAPAISITTAPGEPVLTQSEQTDSYLENWGQPGEFVRRMFEVSNGTLSLREYNRAQTDGLDATANTLVNDIVYLKAQYGMTATTPTGTAGCTRSSDVVTSWVSGATVVSGANSCGVIAIRVGLVARSALRENESVELASANTALTVLPAITSAAGVELFPAVTYDPGTAATRYRHRVYSTIIPLKNVIWSK